MGAVKTLVYALLVLSLNMHQYQTASAERFDGQLQYEPSRNDMDTDCYHHDTMEKRRFDFGYGGRNVAAMNLGSKLLAKEYALRGPGGKDKRRFDFGYGGRNGAAMKLGSKLLAREYASKFPGGK